MSKHTPGPWKFIDVVGCCTIEAHSRQLLKYMSPTSTNVANARLMALAPELLDALEWLIDNGKQSSFERWLANVRPSGDVDSMHYQWLESSEYAEFLDLYSDKIALIAKARGEA